jgi:hypothetical protein
MSETVDPALVAARDAMRAALNDLHAEHRKLLMANDSKVESESVWIAAAVCMLSEVLQHVDDVNKGTGVTIDQITALALMTARGLATGPDGETKQ